MNIPTLSELIQVIKTDFKNVLGIFTTVGKNVINAFSNTQGGVHKIIYLALNQVYNNLFFDKCDSDMLDRFGLVYLQRSRFDGSSGEYLVSVTGEIGAIIPATTTFKSSDSSKNPNKVFVLDSQFTFIGTTGIIQLRALDAGNQASLNVGDILQLTQPLSNVGSFGTVTSEFKAPTEQQSESDYRAEIIRSQAIEAQGGSVGDLMLWADDVPAVRRVYPYVMNLNNNTSVIYVEGTPEDSTNGVPTSGTLAAVVDSYELNPDTTLPQRERPRRPMSARYEVLAITPLPVNVFFTNLSDPALIPNIQKALEAYVFDIRPFIDGADNPLNSNTNKIYKEDVSKVIRDTIGNETFDSFILQIDGINLDYRLFEDGDIPFINGVVNL